MGVAFAILVMFVSGVDLLPKLSDAAESK